MAGIEEPVEEIVDELIPTEDWAFTEPDPSWDNSCPICCCQVADRRGHRNYHINLIKRLRDNESPLQAIIRGLNERDQERAAEEAQAVQEASDSSGEASETATGGSEGAEDLSGDSAELLEAPDTGVSPGAEGARSAEAAREESRSREESEASQEGE